MKLPVYKLDINEFDEDSGIDFISLVEAPAIQKDFVAFSFVEPTPNEDESAFMERCIKYVMDEGKEQEQAVAICYSMWQQNFAAGEKVSFDYDDTLDTAKGLQLAKNELIDNSTLYIISARQDKDGMLSLANDLGIPESRVYATGSNSAKIQKIKELGIVRHYDNNADVISQLGRIGQKFESYTDYPEAAKENAKRGIRLNEEQGNKCATQVGKVRAQQLANSEPISDETVKRVYSYLSRAKEYYNPSDDTACGTISYLLWGGEEMLRWAESKLNFNKFSITNEEKRIVSGVAMVADLPIYRRDSIRGEYYVMFDREAIFKLAKKWARNGKYSSVNQHHESEVKGVHLLESYLIDRERGVNPPKGFEKIADGSWFVSYLVDNDEVWAKVKDGEFKGFSVEGMFDFVDEETELYNKIKRVVSQWDGN